MATSKGNYGKIKYICSECGYNSQKWLGKCPNCETSSKTIANSKGLKMPLAQFPLGHHAMNKRAKYRHSPKSGCALAA